MTTKGCFKTVIEVKKMKKRMVRKTYYKVDRGFFEKLVALLNHSTNPVMDIFNPDKKVKRCVVINYDPQEIKVEFTYYEEGEEIEERGGKNKAAIGSLSVKEFYCCPNCGSAISGEKRKYFICPECGSALCQEKDIPDFKDNYCGHCGAKIASARDNEKKTIEEFYCCSNCGMAISGEKRKYFICPECGSALCQEKDLSDFDDDYCINCGAEIASARDDALAQARKADLMNKYLQSISSK